MGYQNKKSKAATTRFKRGGVKLCYRFMVMSRLNIQVECSFWDDVNKGREI